MREPATDPGQEPGTAPATSGLALTAAAVLATVAVRLLIWFRTAMIGADSPRFIEQAKLFAEGQTGAALALSYHPLYAYIVSFVARPVPDYETAGILVSIAMSAATVIPVMALARWLAGTAAAVAAATMFAVCPYLAVHGADIMSEATYIAFLMGALAVGYAATRKLRPMLLAVAGGLAGLAYLARPEGAGLLGILFLFAFFPGREGPAGPVRRLAAVVAATLAFIAVASPYMLAIGGPDGPVFTKKKRLQDLIGIAEIAREWAGAAGEEEAGAAPKPLPAVTAEPAPGSTPAPGAADLRAHQGLEPATREAVLGAEVDSVTPLDRHVAALAQVSDSFVRAFEYLMAFFFAGLLIRATPRTRRVEVFLLVTVAFYLFVLYRLHFVVGYCTRRHLLPVVTICLPIAGLGLVALRDWIVRRRPALSPSRVFAALLVLALAVALPFSFKAQRAKNLAERRAGEWMKLDAERRGLAKPFVVMADRDKVAYYAGAVWGKPRPRFDPTLNGYDAFIRATHEAGAVYVAYREGKVEKYYPGIEGHIRPQDLELVHSEVDQRAGRYLVYRVLAARPQPASAPVSLPFGSR